MAHLARLAVDRRGVVRQCRRETWRLQRLGRARPFPHFCRCWVACCEARLRRGRRGLHLLDNQYPPRPSNVGLRLRTLTILTSTPRPPSNPRESDPCSMLLPATRSPPADAPVWTQPQDECVGPWFATMQLRLLPPTYIRRLLGKETQ